MPNLIHVTMDNVRSPREGEASVLVGQVSLARPKYRRKGCSGRKVEWVSSNAERKFHAKSERRWVRGSCFPGAASTGCQGQYGDALL